MPDRCKRCGETYDECRYPLSHGLPTIDTIELPSRIRAIGNKTPDRYNSADIAALNDYVT